MRHVEPWCVDVIAYVPFRVAKRFWVFNLGVRVVEADKEAVEVVDGEKVDMPEAETHVVQLFVFEVHR